MHLLRFGHLAKQTFLLLVTLPLLAGCSTTQTDVDESMEIPDAFSSSGTLDRSVQWWTVFDDPTLNQRIEKALSANRGLEATWQSVQESRATLDQARSAYYPTLDAGLSASETKPEDSPSTESYEAGLEAAYEVDLWGRVRSTAKAERARLQADYYDYQSAAISLAAEVTTIHFLLNEYRLQQDLVERQLEANERVLKSLNTRLSSGLIRSSDILRQQQLVESSVEQTIVLDALIGVAEHALAVLLGETVPQDTARPESVEELPPLPELPNTGIPSDLVSRRPDVLSAFFLVEAADADLAAAIADRWPTITVGGSLSTIASSWESLFDSWIRELSGQIIAPLIDGGSRRAVVRRNEATTRRRLADYEQVVLVALQEVEDALLLEAAQSKRIGSKQRQVALAENAYQRLRTEYANGVSEYLDMLTAQIQLQSLQRELVEARRIKIDYRIALYRALAGPIPSERTEDFTE